MFVQKWLEKIFGKTADSGDSTEAEALSDEDNTDLSEVVGYPAPPTGIQFCAVNRLLDYQSALISDIKTSLGFSSELFEQIVTPVIQAYAEFVHLLPASETHHHPKVGGLLRHGLEVALYATKASHNTIFCVGYAPKDARDTEPRWRLGVCLAALIHDAGKAVSDIRISAELEEPDTEGRKQTIPWKPYKHSLAKWCENNGIKRYFPSWTENRHGKHEQYASFLMGRLIPERTFDWIYDVSDGTYIVEAMIEAVSTHKSPHVVSKLIQKADSISTERDLKTAHTGINHEGISVPVDKHILDAARCLLSSKTWFCNQREARVWLFGDGFVHIAWKQAAKDIRSFLEQSSVKGIPRDPDTLADILIEKGIAVANVDSSGGVPGRYWSMQPELLGTPEKPIALSMLRISKVEYIFSGEPPAAAKLHTTKKVRKKVSEAVEGGKTLSSKINPTTFTSADEQKSPSESDGKKAAEASPFNAVISKIKEKQKENRDLASEESAVALVTPDASDKKATDSKPDNAPAKQKKIEVEAIQSTPVESIEVYKELSALGAFHEKLAKIAVSKNGSSLFVQYGKNRCWAGRYPDLIEALNTGESDLSILDTLKSLDQCGLIEPHPINPSVLIHTSEDSGNRVVVFKGKVQKLLVGIFEHIQFTNLDRPVKKQSAKADRGGSSNSKVEKKKSKSGPQNQEIPAESPDKKTPVDASTDPTVSTLMGIRDRAVNIGHSLVYPVNDCRRVLQQAYNIPAIEAIKMLEQHEQIDIKNGQVHLKLI